MRYEIRELGVGGVLDQAIKLTKDNFGLFLKIGLVLFLCTLALGLYSLSAVSEIQDLAQQEMVRRGQVQIQPVPTGAVIGIGILGFLYGIALYPFVNAAMIYAVSNCYLDNPIGVGGAFRRALRVLLPLIGTWIIVVLAIVGIIIPGAIISAIIGFPLGMIAYIPVVIFLVIFGFWIFLIQQVVVIESKSGTGAIKRSRQLMKGNVGTAFVLALLLGIIGWAINAIPQFIPVGALAVTVSALLQTTLFIFGAAAWVVFYFSCRCKAENFDLTILAESVSADDPEQPQWEPSPNT